MKSATLLALSLMVVAAWSQDSARGQTSVAPPVSLAPPKASPPRAGTKNPPAASDRASSTPATSAPPRLPSTDYDGFSVGSEDNDTPDQATPPVRSRAAKNGTAGQPSVDQEDEALKRKLMICQSCK